MRHLFLAVVLVSASSLLAGCQGTLPGKGASDLTPNAITGGEIEVTALDAPAPDAKGDTGAAVAPKAEAAGTAEPQAAPAGEPAKSADEAKPAAADPAAVPAPLPAPEVAEAVAEPKSDAQLACEKKRGKWTKVGKGELRACIFQTRDSGKSCTRESDCEGVCLARSGTCAPYKPLYGCNEILQDDGQRVTLCLD